MTNTFCRKNAYGVFTEKVISKHFLEKSVIKKHFLEKSVIKKHFLEKSVIKNMLLFFNFIFITKKYLE